MFSGDEVIECALLSPDWSVHKLRSHVWREIGFVQFWSVLERDVHWQQKYLGSLGWFQVLWSTRTVENDSPTVAVFTLFKTCDLKCKSIQSRTFWVTLCSRMSPFLALRVARMDVWISVSETCQSYVCFVWKCAVAYLDGKSPETSIVNRNKVLQLRKALWSSLYFMLF